jgi:hypothetical protein
MTKTLTQLVSAVQEQLIDNGTRFTTATCTAALRAALSKLNHRIPIHAGTRIDVIANQKEYELSDYDSLAIAILDILEWDTDGEDHSPLAYDNYTEDERLFFRLRTALSSGEILARYTIHHTISGLDSATESTLSADLDQVITDGACAEALKIRGASRIETINLQQKVSENYRQSIKDFTDAFNLGISAYEMRRSPVSETRQDRWDI